MTERPYEILHIPPKLHEYFDGKIALIASGDARNIENNFLSRSLAAYTIHKLCGCNVDEAAACVVDGGNDGGIDAAYFSPANNTLWLVQSKYIESGLGQPDLHGITRFKTGVEQILQANFDEITANPYWNRRLTDLQSWLRVPGLRVKTILAYSGGGLLAEDRLRLFDDLARRFNNADDFVEFKSYGLVSIHDWITGADVGVGVEKINLDIHHPGWVRDEPYEVIYGRVGIKDLISLYRNHGKQLIAANIRRYKGSSDVNDRIRATAKGEPENLFYLNNGLTAYCDRFEVANTDRANQEKKSIIAHGFCVVNGAQTLGSIEKAFPATEPDPVGGFVFIKIVSLERCEDDREFACRITESTNRQNQIGARDFAAIDELQEKIATQLKVDGIEYHYKDSEETPPSDDANFSLEDATVALACLATDADFNLCARLIANRKSLWSFEKVYPEDNPTFSLYELVFKAEYSARTIWRAVQTYNVMLEKMRAESRAATGLHKSVLENGRWVILKVIFVKLHPERGESVALSTVEKSAIADKTLELAVLLWATYQQVIVSSEARHPKSIFCNSADSKRLYNGVMARLAQPAGNTTPNQTRTDT